MNSTAAPKLKTPKKDRPPFEPLLPEDVQLIAMKAP